MFNSSELDFSEISDWKFLNNEYKYGSILMNIGLYISQIIFGCVMLIIHKALKSIILFNYDIDE